MRFAQVADRDVIDQLQGLEAGVQVRFSWSVWRETCGFTSVRLRHHASGNLAVPLTAQDKGDAMNQRRGSMCREEC